MITLIRNAKNPPEAKAGLIAQFGLSDIQSQAILDMQLQRLTGLERQKILDELAELKTLIEKLRGILASQTLLLQIVVDEMRAVRDKFSDVRRTQILEEEGELSIEDLITEEDVAVTVTDTGYIKRTPISTYSNQRRGGKGRIGMRTREEDVVNHLFVASTHSYLMIFSDRGRAYWLKVHEIPGRRRRRQGQGDRESGAARIRREDCRDAGRQGIRRPALHRPRHPQRHREEDGAVGVREPARRRHHRDGRRQRRCGDGGEAVGRPQRDLHRHARRHGDSLLRGRHAADGPHGLRRRGIQLREGDEVVAMEVVKPGGTLLTVTELGYAKQTALDEYRVQGRGGYGLKNLEITDKNGHVVGIAQVQDDEELLVITEQGKILRTPANDIRTIGRATQGVRLMDLEGDDKIVSVALVEKTVEEEAPNADS